LVSAALVECSVVDPVLMPPAVVILATFVLLTVSVVPVVQGKLIWPADDDPTVSNDE
jgi:uncharacterized paraquat-inducible protein A